MYEAHFGLRERPFSIAPDPRYLYLTNRHRDALAHLLYGVGERGGFIQLTGAVGTGKTTLTRALLEQLPESVDLAFVLNPSVTERELLVAICEDLGIELPRRAVSAAVLMDALRDYLLDAFGRGRHTVVLIDEAQNLSPKVLEQVRLLTNLETNSGKLLQIILVGQPELRQLLAKPELRQVAQRVTARFHLTPLTRAETREYIRHRLHAAGGNRFLFTRSAIAYIHRRARGVPRLINIICDRALLGAYATGSDRVSLRIAKQAAREVEGGERRWPRRLALGSALAAAVVAALATQPLLDRLAPPAAAPAVATAPPQPKPEPQPAPAAEFSLESRLQNQDPALDPRSGLEQLFTLWGGRYQADDERTACEQAEVQGLRCDLQAASWAALIGRDLPAVLELQGGDESRLGVLLTGFDGADAFIRIDGKNVRVPQTSLLAAWTGSAVALWRPPADAEHTILPGSKGPLVVWLARQLDRIEGRPSPAATPDSYDATLRQRVLAFQRARGLAADGIVGENTLFHLVLAAPDPDVPTLRKSPR